MSEDFNSNNNIYNDDYELFGYSDNNLNDEDPIKPYVSENFIRWRKLFLFIIIQIIIIAIISHVVLFIAPLNSQYVEEKYEAKRQKIFDEIENIKSAEEEKKQDVNNDNKIKQEETKKVTVEQEEAKNVTVKREELNNNTTYVYDEVKSFNHLFEQYTGVGVSELVTKYVVVIINDNNKYGDRIIDLVGNCIAKFSDQYTLISTVQKSYTISVLEKDSEGYITKMRIDCENNTLPQ